MKALILLTLGFLLSSCGPNPEDSVTQKAIEDAEVVRSKLDIGVGTFDGYVKVIGNDYYRSNAKKFPLDEVPVNLKLWIEDVPDGKLEDGSPKFTPRLRGIYQRMDMDPELFLAKRIPVEGANIPGKSEFSFKNTTITGGPNPNLWTASFNITFSADGATGNINYDGRNSGTLYLSRVSADADFEKSRDKILKFSGDRVGHAIAKSTDPYRKKLKLTPYNEFDVQLSLNIVPKVINGKKMATIVGTFTRKDLDASVYPNVALESSYDDKKPDTMVLKGNKVRVVLTYTAGGITADLKYDDKYSATIDF